MAARKEEGNTGLHFNSSLIESLMSVEYAGNIIVIKTFPGLANAVAAGIDQLSIAEVLGCVAGDDTIMVVTRNEAAAKLIRERISVMVKKG